MAEKISSSQQFSRNVANSGQIVESARRNKAEDPTFFWEPEVQRITAAVFGTLVDTPLNFATLPSYLNNAKHLTGKLNRCRSGAD